MRESGECEITPSTDVKYPQGSITALHNQWLLIGAGLHAVVGAALLCSCSSQLSAFPHPGHHELPPVVHTTMLRAFPENLRKATETIIPRSSPARSVFDDVSGGALCVTALLGP